jgi:hypothetical protein
MMERDSDTDFSSGLGRDTDGDEITKSLLSASSGKSESEIRYTESPGSQKSVYRNFLYMAIAFSMLHGSVTSCLAYASTELGNELGGQGSGALYVCYAFVALFLSAHIVGVTGPKYGLILGLGGYLVYIVGFLLAILLPTDLAFPIFIFASIVGGSAGGLLWTAQGDYFVRVAQLYAAEKGITVSEANAHLAGTFAQTYLGLEMVTKCTATILFITCGDAGKVTVFTVYTVISFVSCWAVTQISSLGANGTFRVWTVPFTMTKAEKALSLIKTDSRIALLMPFQVSFGLASSLLIYYVFGTIIANSDDLGDEWVGLLSAIVVFVGTLIALPSAKLAKAVGKTPMMILGGCCFSLMGLVLLVESDSTMGTWGAIVPYLCIQGVGRGIWENTNKAVVADFFGYDAEKTGAAFALISFANGMATALGFFAFNAMSRGLMSGLVLASGVVSIICYLYATTMPEPQRFTVIDNHENDDDDALDEAII